MLAPLLGVFFQKTSPNKICLQTAFTLRRQLIKHQSSKYLQSEHQLSEYYTASAMRTIRGRPTNRFVTLLLIPIVKEGGVLILLTIFYRAYDSHSPLTPLDRNTTGIMIHPHPRVTRSFSRRPHQETEACLVTYLSFGAFAENLATSLQPLRRDSVSEKLQGKWTLTTS